MKMRQVTHVFGEFVKHTNFYKSPEDSNNRCCVVYDYCMGTSSRGTSSRGTSSHFYCQTDRMNQQLKNIFAFKVEFEVTKKNVLQKLITGKVNIQKLGLHFCNRDSYTQFKERMTSSMKMRLIYVLSNRPLPVQYSSKTISKVQQKHLKA